MSDITEKTLNISEESKISIFGGLDSNIKKIEKALQVSVVERGDSLRIAGDEVNVDMCIDVILELDSFVKRGNDLDEQNIEYAISLAKDNMKNIMEKIDEDVICHTVTGKPVKPKTLGQKKYVDAIRDNMIVFGLGPAGTGKTYLAMAMAITAFKNEEVSRIILTRPAIEAGEKLGFLPGDLQSKVDPYLRPLYDALYQIMGADSFLKNQEKGLIEVAPLAYMRGRTLDNAYIILDEAQNTTPAQMKMFLTRMGFGSKAVITGDLTQKDLMPGAVSGLDMAIKVLRGMDEISFSYLTAKDVVRHPLVQRIVKAYEDYEARQVNAGKGNDPKALSGRNNPGKGAYNDSKYGAGKRKHL
ncbi:MAG: PhoH family protein [Lachnospiraceae bacterium]|nr:PhoH family protein [Lachnospiraceae bacterium]